MPYTGQNISEFYFDKNGISYLRQVLDFTDEFLRFFMGTLISNQFNFARDCLCAMHYSFLAMLNEIATPQINKLLESLSTQPMEIENEQLFEDCNEYKHLSAMQALKVKFQSPEIEESGVRCSKNRYAFNSVKYKLKIQSWFVNI